MEPSRTRQPQRPSRSRAPLAARPPHGGTAARTARVAGGAGPAGRMCPALAALRGLPSPRLTGLGTGLFAGAVMLFLGFVDDLILGGAPTVYGFLFLPVSALAALWVRTADLVTAPISVPIAFAVGIVPIAGGHGGFAGQVMAVVTALALHAGWLYGGTLIAGVIASVRTVRQMTRERQPARLARADAERGQRRR